MDILILISVQHTGFTGSYAACIHAGSYRETTPL